MLDSQYFDAKIPELEAGLRRRGASTELVNSLKAAAADRKKLIHQVETLWRL
jgi:hypothetical protein